jgi:hypothetical protein
MRFDGRGRTIVAALVSLVALVAWGRTRLLALADFEKTTRPSPFLQGPVFLSGAQGGRRPVGSFSKDQVRSFRERGGTIPAVALDIRAVQTSSDVAVLSRVDPGFCWLLATARVLGLPLSLVGVARFQVGADLLCLLLTYLLVRRVSGDVAASVAALAFGLTSATTTFLVAYYFWSVPLALVLAHLGLSFVRASSANRRLVWIGVILVAEAAAIWLRVAWLPVFLLALPALLIHERGARLALFAGASLAVVTLSYALLIARASREGEGGGLLHPRSQLWHTLYIGLGADGTWGDIQWLDEYAYRMAETAGVDPKEPIGYEAFFKARFLEEVSRHPARYCVLLLRRTLDYCGEALFRMPLLRHLPLSFLGGLVLASIVFLSCSSLAVDSGFVAALCGAQVVTWSALVPPVPPYSVECVGLPLAVAVIAAHAAALFLSRRFAPAWSGASGQKTKR